MGHVRVSSGVQRDRRDSNRVTVRSIGTDGKTIQQAEVTPTTPDQGVLTSQVLPDQCALVVSLLTARTGRSFRGRTYLPITSAGALTNGKMDPTGTSAQAANFMANLIKGLGNSTTTVPTPTSTQLAGAPHIAIQSATSGQVGAPVIAVRAGDVIDTQRRRRNKIVETYSGQEVSY